MIQRVIALFLLLSLQSFASSYDETLITIEAKLFPKIALLEEHTKLKDSSRLNITLLYEPLDREKAEYFKQEIEALYPEKLLGKRIIVKLELVSKFTYKSVDAFIVLYTSEKNLRQIANVSNHKGILTFSYDPCNLKFGLLVSLYIGKTTKPYLNATVIKKYNFTFNPYLLQLAKFTNTKESL